MIFKLLPRIGTEFRTLLICATAIVGVTSIARADELQDIKRQTDLLQRQNQALMKRIGNIERSQRARKVATDSTSSPRSSTTATNGQTGGYAGTNGFTPSTGGGLASSPGGSTASAGAPTVQESRTAGAAPSSAAIGGTPPIPSANALTYKGITLYGGLDIGVAYQSHGTPQNGTYGPGLEYLISKNSNRSLVSIAPNGLSYSNIGLKGVEPILPGLDAVFNVQTTFNPTSGQLSNGLGTVVQNNGVALNRQSSNGDSSRDGQAFNSVAYAGLSSPRLGTLTFGRQNPFTLDGVIAYDPLFASNSFSVIGYQGATAGMGDTEDTRLDSALKYLVNYGPVHAGAVYQLNGENGKTATGAGGGGGRGAYEFDLGAEYAGLNVDAIYSQIYDAVAAASLSPAQVLTAPVGSVAASVSDNKSLMLLAKYKIGAVQLFVGYENILYSNPRDPILQGTYGLAGYQLGVVNNAAYNNNKLFQVFWGGARYRVTRDFSLAAAYYHEHQNSYSGNGCANTSLGSCRGGLDAGSLLLDYRLSPRFDVYAGAELSTVSNGFASGFLHNTTIDPMIGTRFAF
jgi:predicted porin